MWKFNKKDLKSKFFKKNLKDAEKAIGNEKRGLSLLEKAIKKISSSKEKGKEVKDDFLVAIELVKDWTMGNYNEVPKKTILYIMSSIIYFITPFDAVPDFILHFGLLDDFTVISFVLSSFKIDIDKYKEFKKEKELIKENKTKSQNEFENKAQGALLGLACGDALGTTLEFQVRDNRVTHDNITGGGVFNLKAGQWTDDTSMALCLSESLLYSKGFNPNDQMDRYCKWMRHGYLSSNGRCFDIGITTSNAIKRYLHIKDPLAGSKEKHHAGNGSIMRLAPIPIYYRDSGIKDVIKYSELSSMTTHGSPECLEGCKLLGVIIYKALMGCSKDEILFNLPMGILNFKEDKIIKICEGNYLNVSYDQLPNSGYVVSTLESALWCFYNSTSFKDAVVLAANLSGDADTIAAVCGQVAGAYYGLDGIPEDWVSILTQSDWIAERAIRLENKK
jgi:ADP-ribosyl-[dinitrogen reductase] hydrolase